MKYTNQFNLPDPVFRALKADVYDHHDGWSVTTLINPPQQRVLVKRHGEKMITEIMDMVWAMNGNAVHEMMAKVEVDGSIVEQRMFYETDGHTIPFKPDYIYPVKFDKTNLPTTYELLDFKNTSVYAIKKGPKEEWEMQTNMYRFFTQEKMGIDIGSIKIIALLRDWSYTEANVKNTFNYPKSQITVIPIELWPEEKTKAYVKGRIELHEKAEEATDDQLPKCTLEERWASPDSWRVVFKEGKSAGRAVPKGTFFQSESQAIAFMNQRAKNDCKVEFKKGESIRCERYCPVKRFCRQYREEVRNAKNPF